MGRTDTQESLFLVIAHPARRGVLEELRRGDIPATQLAARFDLSASALSQHLKVLKEAGLVSERREGRLRLYTLHPEPLREISDWIEGFSTYWPKKLEALGAHLRRTRK
jgi:DNA-binding transcriptional ArsR family regulator